MHQFRTRLATLALTATALVGMVGPASAQMYGGPGPGGPGGPQGPGYNDRYDGPGYPQQYNNWQPGWDQGRFDRKHLLIGVVDSFRPYRLGIRLRSGEVQVINLKKGTVIRPTGATPQPGQRVAVHGYYSNGTFIANRLILR